MQNRLHHYLAQLSLMEWSKLEWTLIHQETLRILFPRTSDISHYFSMLATTQIYPCWSRAQLHDDRNVRYFFNPFFNFPLLSNAISRRVLLYPTLLPTAPPSKLSLAQSWRGACSQRLRADGTISVDRLGLLALGGGQPQVCHLRARGVFGETSSATA